MSSTTLRRLTAAAGALALAAGGLIVATAPAQAVSLPGNIDTAAARNLTVHKFALGPGNSGVAGNGQELPAGTNLGTPLAGAVFTATVVTGIDLSTADGWTQAAALTPQSAAGRLSTSVGDTYTSTASSGAGLATFPNNMPIALFYVQETVLPAEATNPTAPFLVTLPLPTGPVTSTATPNQWIYDVHVYPKNAVTQLTKTRVPAPANSAEARNPDLIRWAIASSVPVLAPGDSVSAFTLTDRIPAALEFVTTPPTGVDNSTVTVTNSAGIAQSLTPGTDYTITTTPAAGNTQATSTLTFTASGRAALTGLQGGTVSFNALTRAVTIPPNGLITNTATGNINGANYTVTGTTPIGQLTVFAYEATNRTPLAGAVYSVYLTQNDANNQQNPVSINGVNSWTTAANGSVAIPIITPGNYFVRETTAPTGFNQPTNNPVQTVVVAGPTSTVQPVQNYLEFAHSQVSPIAWALPATGGDAGIWFGVGGGALIAIALGAALVVSRRRAAAARAAA